MSSVADLLARVRAIQDQTAALRDSQGQPRQADGRDTALSAHFARHGEAEDLLSPERPLDPFRALLQAYVHGAGGVELGAMFCDWAECRGLQGARRGGFLLAINAEGETVAVLDAQLAPTMSPEADASLATLDATSDRTGPAPEHARARSAKGGESPVGRSRAARSGTGDLPVHPDQLAWPAPDATSGPGHDSGPVRPDPQPPVDRWRCVACGAVALTVATDSSLDLMDRWRHGTCTNNSKHTLMERF